MGYHTEFRGAFAISPPLRAHHLAYLRKFNEIRHEKRDPEVAAKIPDPLREAVGLPLGPDACFFVGEPAPDDPTLLGNFETAPSQPASYYCQWMPSDDGKLLVWDGGEKFYEYVEWLQYLIDNFFVSWGYVINGSVRWQGEEHFDMGTIVVNRSETSLMGRIAVREANGSLRKLRVFLCHASVDKKAVRHLYARLLDDRIEPWLDEEDLMPGQDWEHEVRQAIKRSDLVVVCLSRAAVNKVGFVQKEIKLALDVADEQPEGRVFIIPAKLEECDVPERLKRWHWVNLFVDEGYRKLWRALEARATSLSGLKDGST